MIKLKNDELVKNQEEISLASIEHMINELSKRDSRSNEMLSDISSNYVSNFINSLEVIEAPLSCLNDNFYNNYKYLLSHIKKIVSHPKNKMITEEVMIDKNRIKRINAKTVNWICQKPGPTVKHKLAPIKNIKSIKKIYTLNTKPNQVTKVCIEKLLDLLKSRNEMYLKFPNLFNNETLNNEIKELTKLYSFFSSVDSIIHLSPDNTILGNKHYNAIFKTYKNIKNLNFTVKSSLEFVLMMTKMSIISSNNVEHINKLCKINEEVDFKMYINSNKEIIDFKIELHENNIIIKKDIYTYDGKWNKIDTNNFKFIFVKKECELLKGELYDVEYNETKFEFNFNLEGLKSFLLFILSEIGLTLKSYSNDTKELNVNCIDLVSINSYDNMIDNINLTTMKYDSTLKIIDTSIYDISEASLDNLITLNDLENKNYSNFLSNISSKIKTNDVIIYDVRDDSDEFSSTIRTNFQSNLPNSFPVWRSILAVESYKNTSIKEVVDLCGKCVCVSSTDYDTKDLIYIHNGLMENKYYISSEYEILKEYLINYSHKYSINITSQIPHIISSGVLSNLFNKCNDDLITFIIDDNYVSIGFDNELLLNIIDKITIIDNNELFILPDFIFDYIDVTNKLKNSDLSIGARVIRDKYQKDKTKPCWYEKLADLSLEVNRNGYYDTLSLIKNKKVLNIIGNREKFNVDETFTIPAGVSQIRLPLVRTNVYTKNSVNYDAELPSKYFPLEYPVKAKLTMTYSYNDENMYELKFEPLSDAPFKELIVEWKPRVYSDKIINPVIKPKQVEIEDAKSILTNLHKFSVDEKSVYFTSKLKDKEIIKNKKNKLFRMQNDLQDVRILYPKGVNKLYNVFKISNFENKINEGLTELKKISQQKGGIIDFIEKIEGLLITISTNPSKYFLNESIYYSYRSLGRYFAFAYISDKVNDDFITYNNKAIIEFFQKLIVKSKNNIDGDSLDSISELYEMIAGLTSATMINPKILLDMSKDDVLCVTQIVDTVLFYLTNLVSIMKNIVLGKSELTKKIYNDIKFRFRDTIELTFAMLFLRESIYFSNLSPSGITTNEFIKLFKDGDRYYNILSNMVLENKICYPQPIKTKYNIIIQKENDSLKNVNKEIYSLILFLSGDDDASYISIEK